MDAFTIWKQEVEAEQDRLERTVHIYPEEEQLRRIDVYWVGVVRDIRPDDPDGPRKVRYIQRFANRPNGEYPLTYTAVHNRVPSANTPSITRMSRELIEAEDGMRARRPPAPRSEIMHMLDSKLTNYISDFRKDDPEYKVKWIYFHPFLESGEFPDAVAAFERNGHGKIIIMGQSEIELDQQRLDNNARAHTSPAPGVPWTVGPGGRKTRRRKRRGGKPPKPVTVVVSNPIAIAGIPKPPKPNPAAGTGLFPGGRRRHTRKNRRRGGAEAEDAELSAALFSNQGVDVVRDIVARGANVNMMIGGITPLTLAISKNNFDVVKLLVENGADLGKGGDLGFPITVADRKPEILRYLISRGAKYPEGHFVNQGYKDLVKKTNTEKAMAVEVGVKAQDRILPMYLPSHIAKYLGARRQKTRCSRR
jgi:hypothetical protein